MRKIKWTRKNIMLIPVVFLVRVPILLPLNALILIGEKAERFGYWVSARLPGFEG